MKDKDTPVFRRPDWKIAQAARHATTAVIGVKLMSRWNQNETDPSLMAVVGHETSTGYEFCIEQDGVTYTVAVTRDMDT